MATILGFSFENTSFCSNAILKKKHIFKMKACITTGGFLYLLRHSEPFQVFQLSLVFLVFDHTALDICSFSRAFWKM
jgi:hypothetical protein